MNILIAPNAFKNSLNAQDAAEAIATGLGRSKLHSTCRLFPVGDGGDGTGELIIKHLYGDRAEATVHDPLGREIVAYYGFIDSGRTAVIEMADASGLWMLNADELNPLIASSTGTGEMIKDALDQGARKIIIGMGGSATVDGGAGILYALGIRFFNAEGELLDPIPDKLTKLSSIDVSGLDKRIAECEVIILCDVDNHLLGDNGAAAVFGPQKGAKPEDVITLDAMLKNFADITLQKTGIDITNIKHSGTAGGAAAGLHAFINAKLVSGAPYFLDITGFDEALESADMVITGEGSIDEQTLQGKAPAAVAERAKKHGLPVIGMAGKVPAEKSEELSQYFDELLSINSEPVDIATAIKHTRENLIHTAKTIGDLLARNNPESKSADN